MVINHISQQIRHAVAQGNCRPINIARRELEIPIGYMNNEEKAIYSLMEGCKDEKVLDYLTRRMRNSLRRLNIKGICWKLEKCEFRDDFLIVMNLDISSLIWNPYTSCRN